MSTKQVHSKSRIARPRPNIQREIRMAKPESDRPNAVKRAFIFVKENPKAATKAVVSFTDKVVLNGTSWAVAAAAITLPIVVSCVSIAYEWIVKADGAFKKIPSAILNGLHDTTRVLKPIVNWMANPTHLWTTVGVIVGYIAFNAFIKNMKTITDKWSTKKETGNDKTAAS